MIHSRTISQSISKSVVNPCKDHLQRCNSFRNVTTAKSNINEHKIILEKLTAQLNLVDKESLYKLTTKVISRFLLPYTLGTRKCRPKSHVSL